MCLPMLPALALASGAMSAAGSIVGGLQANAQGKYEAAMANRNAKMEVEAAQESYLIGKDERRDFWRKIGQVKGQQRASMAANMIEVDNDTAARIQDDTQMLANEDARNLYRNIEQRTRGRQINASNFVAESKAARQRGKAALTSSFISAGASLLGGATQAMAYRAKFPPTGK